MKKNPVFILIFTAFVLFRAGAQVNEFEMTLPGTYTSASAVSGWTISSQTVTSCNTSTTWASGSPEFTIVQTPILSFPTIGNIPNSPLGGNNVARLNNSTANGSSTKITKEIAVTSSNSLLQYAFAGYLEDGGHNCCGQSHLTVTIRDNLGSALPCMSLTANATGSSCASGFSTYSVTSGVSWTNWQAKYLDLTPYINQTVTIEVTTSDCICGIHLGTSFFDMTLGGLIYCQSCWIDYFNAVPLSWQVNLCSGSTLATLSAPLGYASYSWTAPSGYSLSPTQLTLSTISLTNASPGNVYTIEVVSPSGCPAVNFFTLTTTTVSILGLGSSPSCPGGASGSATVAGAGSGGGYNYSWLSATNSVVGTSSVVSNLSAGIYSVIVTAAGTSSSTCGTAVATTTVGTSTQPVISLLKTYCTSGAAYLSVTGGTNHQWYNNTTLIPASSGGTLSYYTVASPSNNAVYRLSYLSAQGCQDSIKFTLFATNPGSLNIISNPFICSGASNGVVTFSMNSAAGAPPGANAFSVTSTGTSTPTYTAASNNMALYSFTATSLSQGSYSVTAFDGACVYSKTLAVSAYVFDYTVSPSTSPTLCSGTSVAASITFTSIPTTTQYSYSWTPNNFLAGNANTFQNTIITPTGTPGTSSTLVYSVTVTPSIVNCPLTKTLSLTVLSPSVPVISAIPPLCSNSTPITLTANPAGGGFSNNAGVSYSGIVVYSNLNIGVNTVTYTAPPQSTCAATKAFATFNFNIAPFPGQPLGNFNICAGQSAVISFSSPYTYSWSTGATSSSISVSPVNTTSYSVITATNTNGCTFTTVVTVTVVTTPTITISGNTSLCIGSSATLTASGANSVLWNNNLTSPSIIVSPTVNTLYTVTGINSPTCASLSGSTSVLVQMVPLPILSISGNTAVCEGQSTTLLASGANTYLWNGSTGGPLYQVSPASTSTYAVIGTDALTNCSNGKTITVNVYPNPTLAISGDTVLCAGESIILVGSGADTYNWSTGSQSPAVTLTPANPASYTLIGTNTSGSCTDSKIIHVQVLPCTGIHELGANKSFRIYPNPTNSQLFIETTNDVVITLYDGLGRIILKETLLKGTHNLDLSTYNNGVYQLQLLGEKDTETIRLIKNQ